MTIIDLCQERDISVATCERTLASLQAKGLVTGYQPGNLTAEIQLTANAKATYFAD